MTSEQSYTAGKRTFSCASSEGREALDDLIRLATALCHASSGFILVFDGTRPRLSHAVGIDQKSWPLVKELAFLQRTATDPIVVKEPRPDQHEAAEADPSIKFYAAASEKWGGQAVALIGVVDDERRSNLDQYQQEGLLALARQLKRLLQAEDQIPEQSLSAKGDKVPEGSAPEVRADLNQVDYLDLFDQVHDAIIIFDPETEEVAYANQAACLLHGYHRREFIGRSLVSISRDPEAGKSRIRETLESKGHLNFRTTQYKRDGQVLMLDVNASIINYLGRRMIFSINRDVTKQQRSEERLRRSEEKYRRLIETSYEGIWIVDAQGVTTYVNERLAEG